MKKLINLFEDVPCRNCGSLLSVSQHNKSIKFVCNNCGDNTEMKCSTELIEDIQQGDQEFIEFLFEAFKKDYLKESE